MGANQPEVTVSVVIPAYNAAHFLPRSLASVFAQTLAPHEVIVIDDGSADNTAQVAEQLGAKVIRRPNGGQAAARNTGIQAASGEWIAFLDQDDIWHPEKTAIQIGLVKPEVGVVHANRFDPIYFGNLWHRQAHITPSGAMVRKQTLIEVGGFEESRAVMGVEDLTLWLKIALTDWMFVRSRTDLFEWQYTSENQSANESKMARADLAAIDLMGSRVSCQPEEIERVKQASRIEYAKSLIAKQQWEEAAKLLDECTPGLASRWLSLASLLKVNRLARTNLVRWLHTRDAEYGSHVCSGECDLPERQRRLCMESCRRPYFRPQADKEPPHEDTAQEKDANRAPVTQGERENQGIVFEPGKIARSHDDCKLSNALYLITGEESRAPDWIKGVRSATSAERLAKLGMSIGHVLGNAHGKVIAVSGMGVKYQIGDTVYFSEEILSRSFRLIAEKQPVFIVSGSDPVANIAAICGCDPSPRPHLYLTGHCLVLVFANWKGSPAVFHFGRCDRGDAEIRRKVRGREIGASDPRVSSLVPRQLAFFSSRDGSPVAVEEKKPGAHTQFGWDHIDAILDVWCSEGGPTETRARAGLERDLDRICKSLDAYSPLLERAAERLLQWHNNCRLPGEISHGDLWLSNVLFEGQRISGIIDWEWARTDGHRILDAIHLPLMSYSDFRKAHVAEFLRQVWTDSIDDSELNVRLSAVQSRFGVGREDMKFFTLLLWFDYLAHDTTRWGIPERGWHQKLISPVAPAIQEFLARHGR